MRPCPPSLARLCDQLRRHPAAFLVLVALVFFGPALIPWGGTFIGGADVERMFLWNMIYVKAEVWSGALPAWNPHYYSGHPFIANPSTAVFYPSTWLFVFAPLDWAFNLDAFLHVCLAGVGCCALVRHMTSSSPAGVCAGLAYMLGSYFAARLSAGHITQIHSAALLPWVILALDRAALSGHWRAYALAGSLLGLQLLAGEPQNSYYTFLFGALYLTGRHLLIPRPDRLAPLAFVVSGAVVPVTALLLAAIQLLPSLEFSSLSDRVHPTYAFNTLGSLSPSQLTHLLWPSPLTRDWEYSFYMGLLPWAGLVVAWLNRGQDRRVLLCSGLALLALAFALGEHTPLYRLFLHAVPGLRLFRVPARSFLVVVLFTCVLFGLGVASLNRRGLSTRCQAGVAAVGVGLVLASTWTGAHQGAPGWRVACAAVAGVLGTAAMVFAGRHRRAMWAWGLCLLTAVELLAANGGRIPQLDYPALTQPRSYDLREPAPNCAFRAALLLSPNRAHSQGYYSVNGYTPLVIGDYFRFMYDMAGLERPTLKRQTLRPEYFEGVSGLSSRILGVRYAHTRSAPERSEDVGWTLLETPDYTPLAVIVYQAELAPGWPQLIARLQDRAFDPRRQVIFDRPPARPLPAGEAPDPTRDAVQVTRYAAHTIELQVDASAAGYLVLRELDYPGWVARVDGSQIPIERANGILRAVWVDAGRHEIVFTYRPLSLIAGALVSLLTLFALGLIWLRGRGATPTTSA